MWGELAPPRSQERLCQVQAKLKLTPSPAVTYRAPIGPEGRVVDRVARVLLAPVVDEHLLGAGHPVAGGDQARQPSRGWGARPGPLVSATKTRPRRRTRCWSVPSWGLPAGHLHKDATAPRGLWQA